MPNDLLEKLDPDPDLETGKEIPGGPAVEPGRFSQAFGGAKNKLAKKAGEAAGKKLASKAAGEAAADATATGTGGIGALLRPIIKKATEVVVQKLMSKDWWKLVLKAFWPQIAAGVIIVFFIVIAIALVSRATRGLMGRSAAQASSIFNSDDKGNIQIILGKSYQLSGNPADWYFSQSNPDWANIKLAGWTRGPFKDVGCAITSGAMIAKYYGASNVTPLSFGNYHVKETGSAIMDPNVVTKYLGTAGLNKKIVSIPITQDAILGELKAGNPILANGYKTFESSGQHWVVIAGIKGNRLVVNNPSYGANRSEPFEPGKINGLWAFHDQ